MRQRRYKNGNTTDPNNYRPISILSPFSKVLEKIVHDQMLLFLEKHKILFPYQFGFRKGYSTEQAILEITDNIKTAIDILEMLCGVPQRSTLGPLLFLLYINDISNCSAKLTFRIFADDTSVFYSCKNINEPETVMNEEVQALLKYCAINKLSVNFKKTSFIIFRSPKHKL